MSNPFWDPLYFNVRRASCRGSYRPGYKKDKPEVTEVDDYSVWTEEDQREMGDILEKGEMEIEAFKTEVCPQCKHYGSRFKCQHCWHTGVNFEEK